jgi:hypothetical protein
VNLLKLQTPSMLGDVAPQPRTQLPDSHGCPKQWRKPIWPASKLAAARAARPRFLPMLGGWTGSAEVCVGATSGYIR